MIHRDVVSRTLNPSGSMAMGRVLEAIFKLPFVLSASELFMFCLIAPRS
jgi:hypothetical protein